MRTRKTTAFYIETLVLLIFLLAFMTVLVRMFAAARGVGMDAKRITEATLIAQNATAYCTQNIEEEKPLPQGGTLYYDARGAMNATAAQYRVELLCLPSETAAGVMNSLTVSVYDAGGAERKAKPIITLTTEHYSPAA